MRRNYWDLWIVKTCERNFSNRANISEKMTSVEVQSPAPPPAAEGDSATTSASGEGGPASTYEWLASVPLLSSAGNTVYSWYEGSKNYTRASKYALDSVESSVKYVADTAAPVVKRPSKWRYVVRVWSLSFLFRVVVARCSFTLITPLPPPPLPCSDCCGLLCGEAAGEVGGESSFH